MFRFQIDYTVARCCTAVLLACVAGAAPAGARQNPSIEVTAPDGKVQQVALDRLPRATVDVSEDDKPASYEGVLLGDILAAVGVPRGSMLRGPALSQFVVVEARDGYRVVFTLAELDKGFSDTTVLLAHRRNGAAIDPELGPLRIVVPQEQRHGRWIRQVQRISVREAR
jgi:hypothetical protein